MELTEPSPVKRKQQLQLPQVAITEVVSSSPSPRPSSSEGKTSVSGQGHVEQQQLTPSTEKADDKLKEEGEADEKEGSRRRGGRIRREEEIEVEAKEDREDKEEICELKKGIKSEERRIQESKGARRKEPHLTTLTATVSGEKEKRKKESKSRFRIKKDPSSDIGRPSPSVKPLTPSPSRATLQEEEGTEDIPSSSGAIAKGMRLVIESVIETTDPEAASAIKSSLPTPTTGHKKGIHLDLRSQMPKAEDVEEKRSDKIIR